MASAQAGAPVDLNTLVEHVEQAALANRAHYRPYILTREYRLYGSDEEQPKSKVRAEIRFVPPRHEDYKITQADGSSRGESVVRHLLENQSKAAATGTAPGALSRENYDFSYLGEERVDGQDCFVLGLHAKREEKALINGKAWIDKTTYLVRRVEGEMAKLPSWWLTSVNVQMDFSDMGGMWMQTETRAVAEVRIVGRHIFTSKAVSIEAGAVEASKTDQPGHRSFGRGRAVLGTGVLPH